MLHRVFLAALALSLVGCLDSGSDVSSDVAFETVDHSGISGIVIARSVAVRDNASWLALWAQHIGNHPPSPAPTVDFNKSMVLAVFLGDRPNGCYSVTITRVFLSSSGLTVAYHEGTPPPNVSCTQAFIQPTHIVSVPASDALVQFVKE